MTQTRIPLTELPRQLKALTGQEAPTYRRLYMRALDDRLGAPIERVDGRLFVNEEDLLAIAAAVGLVSTPAKSPKVRGAHRALAEALS